MTRDPGPAGRPDPDPDPGLARARTSLAWLRTAISFAAIGGLILRRDLPAGLVILVLSGVVWATGRLAGAPGKVARPHRLLLIALAVAGVAVLALVVSLLGPQPAGLRL